MENTKIHAIELQKEMIVAMKAVHFNSSTIEALMEALYDLNKKLLTREGRMLSIATNSGVKRESFIDQYLNFNFEINLIQNLLSLNDKSWEKFINRNSVALLLRDNFFYGQGLTEIFKRNFT